jgi:chorismate lyase / 3-hydroxybenzoate synthase
MTPASGLQVEYAPLIGESPDRSGSVLGVATFDDAHAPALAAIDIPIAAVRTPPLGDRENVCEIWRTPGQAASGRHGAVHYRHGEQVLFGCIAAPETEHTTARTALHTATDGAYRAIFATLDALAYPHLLRVWNYVPQINVDTHGTERYRQFNSARREALAACGRDIAGNVPAACALGSAPGSPLVIYFLASRAPARVIENPRQMSAYEYPSQYGPRPVFSRASVLQDRTAAMLFISGTASIVGHRTVHAGDPAAQTRETLINIDALLREANRAIGGQRGAKRFDLESLAFKVYVRNGTDLPAIQAQLNAVLGPRAQLMYLQADICRQDLLVEIEAIGRNVTADDIAA